MAQEATVFYDVRVLLDARMQAGGAGRYGRELAVAMRELSGGPDVILLERGKTILERALTIPFSPQGRAFTTRKARQCSADLIHGLHFELPGSSGIPKVVTIQDLIPLEFPASMPNPAKRRLFSKLVGHSLDTARLIVVPSLSTQRSLIERGVPQEKIRVVPLWVNEVFRPLSVEEQNRARAVFGRGQPYVASLYNPKPHKNFEILEDVATQIGAEIPIVCAGNESVRAAGVRVVGRLSDDQLRLLMGGASVFILPSILEGFGLPVAEALACGTPVVCGAGVGAVEHISDGLTIVDVKNPFEISDALGRLLSDEQRRIRLGDEGSAAVATLSAAEGALETFGVYKEAVELV